MKTEDETPGNGLKEDGVPGGTAVWVVLHSMLRTEDSTCVGHARHLAAEAVIKRTR